MEVNTKDEVVSHGVEDFGVEITRTRERRESSGRIQRAKFASDQSQERILEFETLLSAAPDAMLVASPCGEILLANSQVQTLFGYEPEELIGKHAAVLLPERLRSQHVFKKMRNLSAQRAKDEVYAAGHDEEGIFAVHKNGLEFPAEINLSPVYLASGKVIIGAIRDVSHRVKLERELRERTQELEKQLSDRERMAAELRTAHKLEAIGQLTSGIAHEINTPLHYVSDSISYVREATENLQQLFKVTEQLFDTGLASEKSAQLLEDLKTSYDYEFLQSELPRALRRSEEGLRRVAEIVESMRELAFGGDCNKELADVNRALLTSLRLTRCAYRCVAFVETALAPLALAHCSPGALTQAFVNLVMNGIHAISERFPDGKMGLLRIESSVDEERGLVMVKISDNGVGIRDDLREHIYDPFFTTKRAGVGTGQGLSIARAIIVEGHQGDLRCESRVGEGTSFEIAIPVQAKKGGLT